jgi:hypothetical protein
MIEFIVSFTNEAERRIPDLFSWRDLEILRYFSTASTKWSSSTKERFQWNGAARSSRDGIPKAGRRGLGVFAARLGPTRVVTDETKAVTARYDFLPFGRMIYAGVNGRTEAMKYGPVPSGSTGRPSVRQVFTGKERDVQVDSPLDFFGARYYSAALGRFTSPDRPLINQFSEDPQSAMLHAWTSTVPAPPSAIDTAYGLNLEAVKDGGPVASRSAPRTWRTP